MNVYKAASRIRLRELSDVRDYQMKGIVGCEEFRRQELYALAES